MQGRNTSDLPDLKNSVRIVEKEHHRTKKICNVSSSPSLEKFSILTGLLQIGRRHCRGTGYRTIPVQPERQGLRPSCPRFGYL
jgi:hypothetical protein